ncbi:MAG TPA: 23S rRNA (adenine(2503)-C(2))-methyltransferase RlmN [Desulfotignum sp.]|nr:23S rRNA (adenine(2503)-C(2))-methyltransferase RlmN [Desulfotignum sp.]
MNILAMTLDQVVHILEKEYGKGRFHARALYREIFKNANPHFFSIPEFAASQALARNLEKNICLEPGRVKTVFKDQDLTKFITRLSDGMEIESVIVPMKRYNTLCVSSQVGCRMGCTFCETGRMGLQRSLTTAEITGQLYNARHVLKKQIKNVVFMGMGEPFDNFVPVMAAVQVLHEQKGFDIALRHMTISTAGLVPGIQKLAAMNLSGIRLAVSVNAPDNPTRSQLMPVNNAWPLETLKQTLSAFPLPRKGTFLFEYILIKGVNDTKAHADSLAEFIHPLPVRLNLIPCNPVPGLAHESPSDADMNRFSQQLVEKNIFVIRRWSKGKSVSAGCGQLGRQ